MRMSHNDSDDDDVKKGSEINFVNDDWRKENLDRFYCLFSTNSCYALLGANILRIAVIMTLYLTLSRKKFRLQHSQLHAPQQPMRWPQRHSAAFEPLPDLPSSTSTTSNPRNSPTTTPASSSTGPPPTPPDPTPPQPAPPPPPQRA